MSQPGQEQIECQLRKSSREQFPWSRRLSRRVSHVSIDTMRAEVADAALDAGAVMVNDVSGGMADPDMLPLAASMSVPLVLMHWRGHSSHMQTLATYPTGVVTEVIAELRDRRQAAESMPESKPDGSCLTRDWVSPRTLPTTGRCLHHLSELVELGQPVLVGASRKRFLGELLAGGNSIQRPVTERDDATLAISATVCRFWRLVRASARCAGKR